MADDPIQGDSSSANAPAGDPPAGSEEAVAAEAKAVADKAVADKAAAEGADKGNGEDKGESLITYEAFNMPEGMEVDQEALQAFAPVAQKYGLKQEGAQELVTLFGERVKAQAEAHANAWTKAMGQWRADAEADPEIGGDKFKETEKFVALALEKLGPPDRKDGTNALQEILDITGVGNHVEIVRILRKAGKLVDNDTIDLGGIFGETPKTPAETMYPDQGK